MTPNDRASAADSTPTPRLRSTQIGFSDSSDSVSSIRPGITRRNSRILPMPSSWMSMITPPIRM